MPTLILLTCLLAPEGARDALLNRDTFPVWREALTPNENELAVETLPWVASFHAGLTKAHAQKKPLFLWVMNGHPLGCT